MQCNALQHSAQSSVTRVTDESGADDCALHATQRNAMQCKQSNAMQCNRMQCNALQCKEVQCDGLQRTVLCYAALCCAMPLCFALLYNGMRCKAMSCKQCSEVHCKAKETGQQKRPVSFVSFFCVVRCFFCILFVRSFFCLVWRSLFCLVLLPQIRRRSFLSLCHVALISTTTTLNAIMLTNATGNYTHSSGVPSSGARTISHWWSE